MAELKIRPLNARSWRRAVLYNISEGGIGIYLNGPLRKNQKVSIKINYFKGNKTAAVEDMSGTVRWVHKIGEYRAAGISFEENVNNEDPLLSRHARYSKGK